ncbi:MAG: type II toxin-antitoxin system RelE/ParE family toxin [Nanoarchaeota archaeon]|nr:type II toxin-antitoxin system RelE/ParE family toxin [Nanoarchaeota archaeon]MBU0962628.1 type II toxin-antitoxin system RelE/ParE family toxin [Nanoarchaeota archaeon]
MKFTIDISRTAEKDLDSLDEKTSEIIIKKLLKAAEDPMHFLERLRGYTLYKLRCGDFRLVIRIDTSQNALQVIMADHRKNIYKRLQRMIRN